MAFQIPEMEITCTILNLSGHSHRLRRTRSTTTFTGEPDPVSCTSCFLGKEKGPTKEMGTMSSQLYPRESVDSQKSAHWNRSGDSMLSKRRPSSGCSRTVLPSCLPSSSFSSHGSLPGIILAIYKTVLYHSYYAWLSWVCSGAPCVCLQIHTRPS
jgi:hypothetical protein